jgi:hypothetical protein
MTTSDNRLKWTDYTIWIKPTTRKCNLDHYMCSNIVKCWQSCLINIAGLKTPDRFQCYNLHVQCNKMTQCWILRNCKWLFLILDNGQKKNKNTKLWQHSIRICINTLTHNLFKDHPKTSCTHYTLTFLFKKSLWTTLNNTNVLYLKKQSLQIFTQTTCTINLIQLISNSQVTSIPSCRISKLCGL